MILLLVLVFLSAFLIFALILIGSGVGTSQQTKKVLATLDLVLANAGSKSHDQMIDVRKNELLSTIPWINRWLLKLELAPRLRNLLNQANLKWTAGALILMSVARTNASLLIRASTEEWIDWRSCSAASRALSRA